MRFDVDCLPGELAGQPEEALAALAALAARDGADPADWLQKAVKAAGVSSVEVHDHEEPAYQVVSDAQEELIVLWRRLHRPLLEEIAAILVRAAEDADLDNLRSAVREG